MLHAGVFALRAEFCSWFKAAFGSICLNLHKTNVVFLSEEAKSEYDLDSLPENLMLMMLPFVVGLYELKTTKNLEQCLSSKLGILHYMFMEDVWCANIDICCTVINELACTHAQNVAVGLANSSLFSYGTVSYGIVGNQAHGMVESVALNSVLTSLSGSTWGGRGGPEPHLHFCQCQRGSCS